MAKLISRFLSKIITLEIHKFYQKASIDLIPFQMKVYHLVVEEELLQQIVIMMIQI